jgi:hypothetical protein
MGLGVLSPPNSIFLCSIPKMFQGINSNLARAPGAVPLRVPAGAWRGGKTFRPTIGIQDLFSRPAAIPAPMRMISSGVAFKQASDQIGRIAAHRIRVD